MSAPVDLECRIVAAREPDSRLWTFSLINDGRSPIESAELAAVRYEWGDQYLGGESPGTQIGGLAPGVGAPIWRDDGSSEMRTDLWVRVRHQGLESWLLFEFPKLCRQTATTLVARPTRMERPPDGIP
jgi:hypothetical protein